MILIFVSDTRKYRIHFLYKDDMENKQDILKQLASNDMEVVKSAIEQIKQEGDISIAAELLDI